MAAAARGADALYLRRVIALSERARAGGRQPFAALVVSPLGDVLPAAENRAVGPDSDATGHAELEAVRAASRQHSPEALAATLYSSAEARAMCAGAIYWSGIGRLVYGLSESRLRAPGFWR
ncbi:MAG TPA: nucleoside deaminase [Burkholderiales bacterium]|nr:nucleoside deaminase [Burkholderiales bacterium]